MSLQQQISKAESELEMRQGRQVYMSEPSKNWDEIKKVSPRRDVFISPKREFQLTGLAETGANRLGDLYQRTQVNHRRDYLSD